MIMLFIMFLGFCVLCGVLRFVLKLSVGLIRAIGILAVLPIVLVGCLLVGVIRMLFTLMPLILICGLLVFVSRFFRKNFE